MPRSWRIASGWSAVQKWGGKVDFTATWGVELDSRSDGPQVAADFLGIMLGSTYSYGNESDPFAFAKSISPQRRGDSNIVDVTIVFGPIDNEEQDDGEPRGRDEDGNPTDDPLAEAPSITVRPIFMTRVIEKAVYRGQFKEGQFQEIALDGRPVGTDGGVVNSANVPFDPPLEGDYFRTGINISLNLDNFDLDAFKSYVNTVNSLAIGVNRVGFNLNIQPYTGKITNINGQRRSRNGQIFWEADLELQIDDVFTWRVDVLDRGYMARACDGDPDGDGNPWDYEDPVTDGQASTRVIRDRAGDPITEPTRLDGAGQPLKCADADVFLRYSIYKEVNWVPLNQWLK